MYITFLFIALVAKRTTKIIRIIPMSTPNKVIKVLLSSSSLSPSSGVMNTGFVVLPSEDFLPNFSQTAKKSPHKFPSSYPSQKQNPPPSQAFKGPKAPHLPVQLSCETHVELSPTVSTTLASTIMVTIAGATSPMMAGVSGYEKHTIQGVSSSQRVSRYNTMIQYRKVKTTPLLLLLLLLLLFNTMKRTRLITCAVFVPS